MDNWLKFQYRQTMVKLGMDRTGQFSRGVKLLRVSNEIVLIGKSVSMLVLINIGTVFELRCKL